MVEDEELKKVRQRKLRKLNEEIRKKASINKPIKVTDDSFTETIQNFPLVVVDCWAPWCAPCRMVAPILEEMALDFAGKIIFGKLNVDENQKVTAKYGIMSIPTLLVFKNGRLVDQIVGAMPRRMLEPKITQHL